MDSDSPLLSKFARAVESWRESRTPLNTNGAVPENPGDLEDKTLAIKKLLGRPAFALDDLPAYLDAIKHVNTVGLDDRLMLLEKVLVLMSRLEDFDLSMKIQQAVINLLYQDLPHPPSNYAPPSLTSSNYVYRSADGSNYNPLFPNLGCANTPYARTVPSVHPAPRHTLPDPSLVFDTLLRRPDGKDSFKEHPGGISSLFFAFADLVIHSIFNTNHKNPNINATSSYLDLSILYGNSDEDVKQVRNHDGMGRLHNDVFADSRLLFMPPASCALLVLLCRNHNFIAEKIFNINEQGMFKNPALLSTAEYQAQDDEIFHRARLVNCGFFMQIILGDYVGAILGLARDECAWRLDPLMAMRNSDHTVSPRGEGNVVSVEFNLMYRWHSTISTQDADWIASVFKKLFDGKNLDTVTAADFKEAAHKHMIPKDPVQKWTFADLKRLPSGAFADDDLARLIQDATSWYAGAFRAMGTPAAMKVIEVMGIEQSRAWGSCSMNEFRKFMGLKPFNSFEDWNSDPNVYKPAEALYNTIDNLELYVGLHAEEAKPPMAGAGLCPGYTISRAILADAVCLTRGDRFLTTEFTPKNLTSWGYQDCQYDKKDGSFGGMLTKLLFRTLPRHYPARSAYAHFPFLVPSYMKAHMEKSHAANNGSNPNAYIWTRPRAPKPMHIVNTYDGVKQVLQVTHPQHYTSAYNERLAIVSGITNPDAVSAKEPKGGIFGSLSRRQQKKSPTASSFSLPSTFVHSAEQSPPSPTGSTSSEQLAREDEAHMDRSRAINALVHGRDGVTNIYNLQDWSVYFGKKVQGLIEEKKTKKVGGGHFVDIVRDVINLLPVRWIGEVTGLPLKTQGNERGSWRDQATYDMFADVGRYIYLNTDPVHDWRLRESATQTQRRVTEIIEGGIDHTSDILNKDSLEHKFLTTVKKSSAAPSTPKLSNAALASHVFAATVPTAAIFSRALALVVEYYLEDGREKERARIIELAEKVEKREKGAKEEVIKYVHEALPGVYRTAMKADEIGPVHVGAGDLIFASIGKANTDPSVFGPNSTTFQLERPEDRAAIVLGVGENGMLSDKFFESVVPPILGAILGLKNLKRGPGESGKLDKYVSTQLNTPLLIPL
ncbi:heme peroxidase [Infundibulicybe gibba]|nr:heme peroxidase [Infundibulicybe gibba]